MISELEKGNTKNYLNILRTVLLETDSIKQTELIESIKQEEKIQSEKGNINNIIMNTLERLIYDYCCSACAVNLTDAIELFKKEIIKPDLNKKSQK